jgi:hypothetical protein
MSDPIPEAYAWLADAIRPHCDRIISNCSNYGFNIGIGCEWGRRARIRVAILVESEHFSLNEAIERGRLTQRDAIKRLLTYTPML